MSANRTNIFCKCTKCKLVHSESDRIIGGAGVGGAKQLECPACRCKTFYDISPYAAWCFASGLINFGIESDMPEGAILIATGPKAYLVANVQTKSRHAYNGDYLVPGVPESKNEVEKSDALSHFLNWCQRGNGKKYSNGVVYRRGAVT
jgi:hypothetical protein